MPTNLVGDRYELIEILGDGGFAVTHRAWDSRLDRPVAIKLLRPHFAANEIFVQRFVREARAAASVSHPNVVRLYDFGDEGGVVYIAMQYVLGETLRDLLRRFPRGLTLATALQLFRGVLSGLGAVHAAGIVHRDIKPDNVLLDREGRPLITDFGIALLGDQLRLTTAETAYGTAAYMAPEQARGEEIGPAADLYSAGVVLFEMLTGRLPFAAESAVAMMLAHQEQHAPRPSQIAGADTLPAHIDAAVMRALEKLPGRRFQSAAEFSAALDRPRPTPHAVDPRLATLPIPTVAGAVPRSVDRRRAAVAPRRPVTWLLLLAALIICLALAATYATGYFDEDDPADEPLRAIPTGTMADNEEPTIGAVATDPATETPSDINPTEPPAVFEATETNFSEPPPIVSEVPDNVTVESISSPES